jgi:hypothetical protein
MMFYMNEAAFDLPDAPAADGTVHELIFKAADGASFSLTVHRQPLPPGETLASLVAANIEKAKRSLPSHTLLLQRQIEVAGVTGIEVAVEWRGEQSMLYTRQAHLPLDGAWLVFAGNSPLAARAECDALLDRVLASFRPRETGETRDQK